MKKYFYSCIACLPIALSVLIIGPAFAQQRIQSYLNKLEYTPMPAQHFPAQQNPVSASEYQLRLSQFYKAIDNSKAQLTSPSAKQLKLNAVYDTLWIGKAGQDTTITGTFNHTGPIVVFSNKLTIHKSLSFTNDGNIIVFGGKMQIDSSIITNKGLIYIVGNGQFSTYYSQLTNDGDLYVFGKGQATLDLSTVHFPQAYFYQRSMLIGGAGQLTIKNTSLNYDNLSHGCTVLDSAKLVEFNVNLQGFTTTGMSGKGSISINGTNEAGEFIISDRCNLSVKKSIGTALLWHQFPDTAVINWSFGKSDTAYNYQFNKTKSGVKGIEYNVTADSCYKIMWATMPASGSTVTINNSKVRAIGLWFDKPKDSVVVNGIFDSTLYTNNTIGLSDRTLKLNNSYVQTWSFYTFKNSKINITNCRAGEIGSQQTSRVYGNGYKVDGTGGYHWTTDSAVAFANNLTCYSYVRSEKNSLFVVGYSQVVNAVAISKSILIVVQTLLINDPVALEGAVAWYANINQPGAIYTNTTANISGSAYIDLGPTSTLMDFKSWSLYYQKQGDLAWSPIKIGATNEVRRNLLSTWNTNGLASGSYLLKLTLKSTYGDSVDAIAAVSLLPGTTAIEEQAGISALQIYPNPALDVSTIEFKSTQTQKISIELTDLLGKEEFVREQLVAAIGTNTIQLSLASLNPGIYLCKIVGQDGTLSRRIEIVK